MRGLKIVNRDGAGGENGVRILSRLGQANIFDFFPLVCGGQWPVRFSCHCIRLPEVLISQPLMWFDQISGEMLRDPKRLCKNVVQGNPTTGRLLVNRLKWSSRRITVPHCSLAAFRSHGCNLQASKRFPARQMPSIVFP